MMDRVQFSSPVFLFFVILTFFVLSCGRNEPPEFLDIDILSELEQPYEVFSGQTIELEIKVEDPDQDELVIEWTARNGKYEEVATVFKAVVEQETQETETEGEQDEPNKGPKVYFSAEQADIYAISVTVSDGNGHQIQNSTFIKVNALNKPPILDGTSPVTLSPAMPHYVDQEIFLVAQASDPDNDTLVFEWSARDQENSDAGGLIEEGSGASAKFRADSPGSYLVSVLVKDNRGGQDRDSVIIVVNTRLADTNGEPEQEN